MFHIETSPVEACKSCAESTPNFSFFDDSIFDPDSPIYQWFDEQRVGILRSRADGKCRFDGRSDHSASLLFLVLYQSGERIGPLRREVLEWSQNGQILSTVHVPD
jgi:hypothetical protein